MKMELYAVAILASSIDLSTVGLAISNKRGVGILKDANGVHVTSDSEGAFGDSAQTAQIIPSAQITVRLFARSDPLCVRK